MEDNNLELAWLELHNLDNHTFLTGNAGTGKSTLIRKFIEANKGEVIVLAPTGIAAVNIGGQTVHSFFRFPARPIGYNQIKWLNPMDDLDAMKFAIIARAKYIVIDEISMVRADLMDQIAWYFHKNFPGTPFGRKKIIMIGDVDQLPPVLATEEEKVMIYKRYKSEFFFHANCWNPDKHTSFKTFTLTKVFRQQDPRFVKILNEIKNNKIAPFTIDALNNTCYRDGVLDPKDGIMLCARNADADYVNSEMISRLPGDIITLNGEMSGDFDKKKCRVEPIINLKENCRVMLMINSGELGYSNGSIGTFVGTIQNNEGHIFLKIVLDNGQEITINKCTFESIEFTYDQANDRISCKPTGKFVQYPIKVAYAITIHKAQGQTFEKVIIDLGEYGAFAHGQVYVALSRCTSMEGIILRRHITSKDLIYHKSILEFNKVNA